MCGRHAIATTSGVKGGGRKQPWYFGAADGRELAFAGPARARARGGSQGKRTAIRLGQKAKGRTAV